MKGPPAPKQKTYYVHPECKLPEASKEAALVDDGVESDGRLWEWKGDESLHPVWVVQRFSGDELNKRNAKEKTHCVSNLKLVDQEFSLVTVGASGGESISVTISVDTLVHFGLNLLRASPERHSLRMCHIVQSLLATTDRQ